MRYPNINSGGFLSPVIKEHFFVVPLLAVWLGIGKVAGAEDRVCEIVATAVSTSPVCRILAENVAKRDAAAIELINSMLKVCSQYDRPKKPLQEAAVKYLAASEERWKTVVAAMEASSPEVKEATPWPLRSQTMVTSIRGPGILEGAKYIIKNPELFMEIMAGESTLSKAYIYNYPGITLLSSPYARGTPRMSDLYGASFYLLYAAASSAEDQEGKEPVAPQLFAPFARSLAMDPRNSPGMYRVLLPETLRSKLPEESGSWQELDEANFMPVFHAGYAYGGLRAHPDKGAPLGPTDCSAWLVDLLSNLNSDGISTATFMESAERQRTKISAQWTDFDRTFSYVGGHTSSPKVGSILCKPGHVVVYLGAQDGKHVTLSASRDRTNGIEGIGIRVDDPLVSNPEVKEFAVG